MAAYADYPYYITEYGGAAIPSEEFDRFALRASMRVDLLTMGRAEGARGENAVKNAVCAAAEAFYREEEFRREAGFLESQTVGKLTVHYREHAGGFEENAVLRRVDDAARQYLFPAGLLFRGCG